jgi:hypothetical protein
MKLFVMHNPQTGETVRKNQKTQPRMTGFTCVASERVLPERDERGRRLFRDGENRPYYAKVNADGFHRQP